MSSNDNFYWWARAPMRVLSTAGIAYLAGLTPYDASTVGRHWNAVRAYLETGDIRALDDFAGVTVEGRDDTGAWVAVELEADPDAIDAQAWRGEVSFESIYDEVQ